MERARRYHPRDNPQHAAALPSNASTAIRSSRNSDGLDEAERRLLAEGEQVPHSESN
jgi:hypothetical protein